MEIMLDADVIISGEKGIFALHEWLDSRPDDLFGVAAITVAELWRGVEGASAAHRAKRKRYLEAFIDAIPVVPYTEQTAYHHARIWANLTASGQIIGAYNLILAATALERGSSVATFNTRHFSHVKGLKILSPH